MARSIERLPASPKALLAKAPGLHPDGRGLYLQVKNGGRSWVLRYMMDRKARYMGLGGFPEVSLAKARDAATKQRGILRNGIDPIESRRSRRQATRIEAAKSITFKDCAGKHIKSKKPEWRNEKHAAQWESTLATYAYHVIGTLPVQAVDTGLVIKVLEPIWTLKTETATRLRQRIEAVLDWATAHGHRSGDNPARWRGHLNKLLPKPRKVTAVKHFEALPYTELPAFFAGLRERETVSARALLFTILNAARSGETRLAHSDEVDFKTAIWTVPASRTKSGREHRVPLSRDALALLSPDKGLLFPNAQGEPLSDSAMRKYLQEDMKRPGLTVHGFRSTFRDWTAERTNVTSEIAEAALAHIVGDKTEAAYRRGDALDRRRRLMETWAKYCTSGHVAAGKVVPLHGAR
jgi:integrase